MNRWFRLIPHKHKGMFIKCYCDKRPRIHNFRGPICEVCGRCGVHVGPHGVAGWYGRFMK